MADYAIHDTTLEAIADTIRKKDGTQALIDPADYADRIDLMGMLEEKTASSASVCSFSDGADDVPMKSVVAHIAPTLTGTNAVNMVQINSDNLFLLPENDFSVNSVDFKVQNNALIIDGTVSGGSNISSKNQSFKDYFSFGLPAGTYYFTRGTWNKATYVYKLSDDTNALVTNSGSFTLSEYTVIYIGFYISLNTSIDNVTFDGYIKQGSTASSYSPPTQPTQYTASLGRTIYGGTADIVSGQGIDNCTRIQIKDRTWEVTTVGNFQVFTCNKITTKEANFNFVVEGYENAETYRNYLADKQCGTYNITNAMDRICIRDDAYLTAEAFVEAMGNNYIVYENTSPTAFTFDGQEIPSLLGVNNLWHDAGETEAVYRSSGTVTPLPPVPPVLISKSITQNGTYSAEDDDADGYDEVTVNVQGSAFTPAWSEAKIVDNSSLASSITFTADYHNYDMIKIVIYNSSSQIYDTIFADPAGIDKAFTYSSNHFCVNQQVAGSSNQYACYNQDSLLSWSRVANRNVNIYEVYGITFTNCTLTKEVIYSRDAIASGTVTPTAPTGKTFFDYDAIMYMVCTTDANVTCFSKYWISKPKTSLINTDYAVALMAYNSSRIVIYTETSIGTHNYFYVVGLKFTAT